MSTENKKKKKKVVATKKTTRNASNNKNACKKCKASNKALKVDLKNARRKQNELERAIAKLQKQVDRLNKKAKADKSKKSKKPKKASAKKAPTKKTAAKKTTTKKPAVKRATPKKTTTKSVAKKVSSSTPPSRPQPKKAPANPAAPRTRGRRPAPPSDLKIIEGIGPAIEKHLNAAGIRTFAQLGRTSIKKLKDTLVAKGGNRYAMYDPSTWPQQSKLAAANKMDELKILQDQLIGGKK